VVFKIQNIIIHLSILLCST